MGLDSDLSLATWPRADFFKRIFPLTQLSLVSRYRHFYGKASSRNGPPDYNLFSNINYLNMKKFVGNIQDFFFALTSSSFCLLQLERKKQSWLFPTIFLCLASKIIDARNQAYGLYVHYHCLHLLVRIKIKDPFKCQEQQTSHNMQFV